ncbi:DUF2510 domain-containing protein [Nocardioides aequoreus]|uniref:DUF2510 domain-containing protein n=1 Tax=Nocardioides aequoreus TaxID=397278 RepID=UPI0004C2C880|nr:DUF2510 domain-containing protein [Nocardioides aequoreus]
MPETRPAGWYRDPQDPHRHRHWDGGAWATASAEETFGVETRAWSRSPADEPEASRWERVAAPTGRDGPGPRARASR